MMNKDLTEWACWTAKGINVNGKDYCQGHIVITDAKPVRPKECMVCMFAERDSFGLTGCCSATNDSPLIEFHKHKRMEWCPLCELSEERKDNHPMDSMFSDALEALDKMEKSMSTES